MKRCTTPYFDQAELRASNLKVELTLPDWTVAELEKLPEHIGPLENRMREVIRFARLNFQNDTGGPFAAGIFEQDSGKVVVIGVNRVVPQNMSVAHAEIVAITMAQKMLETFDLGGPGLPAYQIVVNARPCAMCFGSIPWSGVRSLAISATGKQVEEITGFDEGPIHPDWQSELRSRGIEVIEDVLIDEGKAALQEFAASGKPVYNARSG